MHHGKITWKMKGRVDHQYFWLLGRKRWSTIIMIKFISYTLKYFNVFLLWNCNHYPFQHEFHGSLYMTYQSHTMMNTAWAQSALSDFKPSALTKKYVWYRNFNIGKCNFSMPIYNKPKLKFNADSMKFDSFQSSLIWFNLIQCNAL